MIVDTFLFSESYESELLLLKLHLESPVVSHFYLIESAYTFRGEFKGLNAKKLIAEDDRFAPFRERITVVEHGSKLSEGKADYSTFYAAERNSRISAWQHIKSLPQEAWVIVSDVDEAADFSDPNRRDKMLKLLERGDGVTLHFEHMRYWWDFDNASRYPGTPTPFTQIKTIASGQSDLDCRVIRRGRNLDIKCEANPLVFEYTFCFTKEGCWKKLNSFIHDGYTQEELNVALATNHWVKSAARGETVGERGQEDWLETVKLNEDNSPAYVRDNLSILKTHLIPTNYKENRKAVYGV